MRKLKPKYKWHNRESHFLELEKHRKLMECYGKALMFGLRPIEINSVGGLLKYITGPNWTEEEIKKMSAHTTVKSALE